MKRERNGEKKNKLKDNEKYEEKIIFPFVVEAALSSAGEK